MLTRPEVYEVVGRGHKVEAVAKAEAQAEAECYEAEARVN